MATRQQVDLGALFFGTYRKRVLSLLLLHADESFHLREIARLTKTQPGTLRRELSLLSNAGVLESEQIGNQVRYRANPACPVYDELRGMLRKTTGIADILREALSPLRDRISLAFVYGSIADGTEVRASDIDLMIVGTVTLEDVVRALQSAQQQLRREINPSVYRPAEFRRKAQERGGFISRVVSRAKLFIAGNADDLGKSGAHRKAETA